MKKDSGKEVLDATRQADPVDAPGAGIADAVDEGGDALMADAPSDINIDAELARAKAEFNDPFGQLKSMLPFLHDDSIRGALEGRSVEDALVFLKVVSPARSACRVEASGLGGRITAHPAGSADSAADFIWAKLHRLFVGPNVVPKETLADLYQARGGDIHAVVDALRNEKRKFTWDSAGITNDWRDWCDAQVMPQAASPVSTALDDMNMLVEPPTYDYNKEASFLTELINMSHIILHPGINIAELTKTYHGQFPAILHKMTVSYSTAFPSHWTEKWLMEGYSRWLLPPAGDSPSTPRNAATRQTTAPVVDLGTADSQRTCTHPLLNNPHLITSG